MLGAGALAFFGLAACGVNWADATKAAFGLVTTSGRFVYTELEKREARRTHAPEAVKTLAGYHFRGWALAAIGVVWIVGAWVLSTFLAGMGVLFAALLEKQISTEDALVASVWFKLLLVGWASYRTGRLMGERSARWPLLWLIIACSICMVLRSIDFLLGVRADDSAAWATLLGLPIFEKARLASLLLLDIAKLALPGVVGLWAGHRRRLRAYLGYLVELLPPDTRDALVTLAYEDAKRLVSKSAAPSVVPATSPAAYPSA